MGKLIIDFGIDQYECTEFYDTDKGVGIDVKEYPSGKFIGEMWGISLPDGSKYNDEFWHDDLDKFKRNVEDFLIQEYY
jgi:hypothetical protein